MRNPKWHRDELILALDLYFSIEPGKSPPYSEILALSQLLNKLPIFTIKPNAATFRNPNGVGLKLSNFLAVDPAYAGKGMERGSKLDKEIFFEFNTRQEDLRKIASNIRNAISNPVILSMLYTVPDDPDDDTASVREGQVLYKLHKIRDRSQVIIKKKKESEFKKHGKLACEVCLFVFSERYGTLGNGFIECHHRVPLAELDVTSETHLSDLALVCSNCHRMLHKRMSISINDLKELLA